MEGNQGSAAQDRVFAIDSFEPRVARAIQLEGAGFYLHGRIAVVARDRARVHAVVRAGRPHDVAVIVGESGTVTVACDCVTFQQSPSVCRHVWATLIKIQNEDLLRLPATTAAVP